MSVWLCRVLTFSDLQTNEKQSTKSSNLTVIVGCVSSMLIFSDDSFTLGMRSLIILDISMFLNVYISLHC